MCLTGNGATLAFTTHSGAYKYAILTLPEETLEALEDSDLSTTNHMSFCPSDLADGGELTAEYIFDTLNQDEPPVGTLDDITITFPLGDGEQTAAKFVASGFITSLTRPVLENGTIARGTFVFKVDGKAVPPAYTPAVASP